MPNQITRYQWLIDAVNNHNSDECLIWPFATHRQGYGWLRVSGRVMLAHRVAYLVRYGVLPVPAGLHSCDVPACFNPTHISPGTQLQNMGDSVKRGRKHGAVGERNSHAVVTEKEVKEIRRLYALGGHTQVSLAELFGLDQTHIGRIVLGKSWRHVE